MCNDELSVISSIQFDKHPPSGEGTTGWRDELALSALRPTPAGGSPVRHRGQLWLIYAEKGWAERVMAHPQRRRWKAGCRGPGGCSAGMQF